MRRRSHYKKPNAKKKIPTLIIMCVTLFVILYFGKSISSGIAGFFAPKVPVTDEAVVAVPDEMQPASDAPRDTPANSGVVVDQANKNAAQSILKVLSKPSK